MTRFRLTFKNFSRRLLIAIFVLISNLAASFVFSAFVVDPPNLDQFTRANLMIVVGISLFLFIIFYAIEGWNPKATHSEDLRKQLGRYRNELDEIKTKYETGAISPWTQEHINSWLEKKHHIQNLKRELREKGNKVTDWPIDTENPPPLPHLVRAVNYIKYFLSSFGIIAVLPIILTTQLAVPTNNYLKELVFVPPPSLDEIEVSCLENPPSSVRFNISGSNWNSNLPVNMSFNQITFEGAEFPIIVSENGDFSAVFLTEIPAGVYVLRAEQAGGLNASDVIEVNCIVPTPTSTPSPTITTTLFDISPQPVEEPLTPTLSSSSSLPPVSTSTSPTPLPTPIEEIPFEVVGFEDEDWIKIPAGSFYFGGSEEDEIAESSTRGELPADPNYNIPYDYWISKFEVTNSQYKLFVDSRGLVYLPESPVQGTNCTVWNGNGTFSENLMDHPVVCVSWFKARDYADWLNSRLDNINYIVMLPSEPEWEKAARGIVDDRIYPWGYTFDGNKLNYLQTKLEFNTSPIGSFPEGASPFGVQDMSGNVWEWTRSKEVDYPYDPNDGREELNWDSNFRVRRGGAWRAAWEYSRISERGRRSPMDGFEDDGIRLIVIHIPHPNPTATPTPVLVPTPGS